MHSSLPRQTACTLRYFTQKVHSHVSRYYDLYFTEEKSSNDCKNKVKIKLKSHIPTTQQSQDLNLDMTHALFCCCQSSLDLLYNLSLKLYMFYVFVCAMS